MQTPVRFPNGVATAEKGGLFGALGMPSPTRYHTYFDDFDTFTAGQWTITTTEAGGGSASEALTNADGGVLLVTNDAADDDHDFFQKVGESFLFEAGKQLWFEARLKISDATQSDLVVGLQITDTSPLAVSDGVYFLKTDGAATVSFIVGKGSTLTTTAAVGTLVSDTWTRLGFYYNGKTGTAGSVAIFLDGAHVGTSAVTNLPDTEELAVSFGIQNGEAVAKILSLDYILAVKER